MLAQNSHSEVLEGLGTCIQQAPGPHSEKHQLGASVPAGKFFPFPDYQVSQGPGLEPAVCWALQGLRDYCVHKATYRKFHKRQNYRDEEEVSDCQG